MFNQLDIVAALNSDLYLAGSYGSLQPNELGNVEPVSVAAPEPSTLLLALVGLLAVAATTRRGCA